MNVSKWLQQNTHSLAGKCVAITGSTGGLGKPLCDYLASLGADLILLDRNPHRSYEHKEALLSKHKGINVTCVNLDLEDLPSAERAVNRLIELGVDIFIHNAGAYSIPRHKCKSGYDNVFQINFATPYFMVKRLLPALRVRKGRVVAVSSIAHNYSKIDESDIDFSTRTASSKVYGNAKRYLMFALHELFKNEPDATLSIAHPGITFTNITAHYPKLIFAIIKHPMKVIFMKPEIAALCVLKAVFEGTAYHEWIGPSVFDIWGKPKKKSVKTCTQNECAKIATLAQEVYNRCEETLEV